MKTDKKGNELQPKNYKLTPAEKETILRWDDSSDECCIYTCNKSLMLELQRKGYTVTRKDKHSMTFSCNNKHITFRTIKKTEVPTGRKLSDEQKAKMKAGRIKSQCQTKGNIM